MLCFWEIKVVREEDVWRRAKEIRFGSVEIVYLKRGDKRVDGLNLKEKVKSVFFLEFGVMSSENCPQMHHHTTQRYSSMDPI